MAIIPVRDWMPDAADFGNPGSIVIKNCIPGVTSYKPIGTLNPFTGALDTFPRGAINALDKDNNVFNYAGDAAKLYRLISTTWTDSSKVGGYSTGTEEVWDFTRWKNKILATNWNDNPQQLSMGGTTFSDLTTDFRCRRLTAIRDHVIAANTFDAADGNVPDRIRWSAIDDEMDWTVSPTTGADVRDLKVGGGIQRVIGGDYGVILSERNTWRMIFDGAPTFFRIDEILPGVGALAPGAVVQLGATVYYLSNHGFIALTNASQVEFIGAGKVDQFVLNDIDQDFLYRMSATADPEGGRVAFAYPGPGNTGGRPNKIIIYDRTLNKWSFIEEEVELIWRAAGVGTTLDDLDSVSASIDDLPVSLDSSRWKGGAPKFGAFDESFRHGFFDGTNMTAVIDTKESEINQGRNTRLTAFRPLVDGGTVTAQVGTRSRQSDAASFGSSLTQSSSGRFTTRANARFHRFRLTVSDDWNDAIGVEVDPHEARPSERRG